MDIGPDDDIQSHSRPLSVFTSSPPTSTNTTSTSSSPQTSVFSYNRRSSRRSTTSSSISSVGDQGQSEEDVAYYSDGDPQGALTSGASASQGEQLDRHGGFPCPISHGDGYGEVITSPRTLLQAQNVAHWSRLSGANRPSSIKSPLPLSCRQNPRRTQRSSRTGSSSGNEQPNPRPPPQLVRQCERKDSFVESLVGELEKRISRRTGANDEICVRYHNSND